MIKKKPPTLLGLTVGHARSTFYKIRQLYHNDIFIPVPEYSSKPHNSYLDFIAFSL